MRAAALGRRDTSTWCAVVGTTHASLSLVNALRCVVVWRIKSNQIKTNQTKSNQIKSNQIIHIDGNASEFKLSQSGERAATAANTRAPPQCGTIMYECVVNACGAVVDHPQVGTTAE